MILYQDCSSHLDLSKNMAARGWGIFSLYIYIENFKNLLVRNPWTDFNIILQKCSFDEIFILYQDCSSHLFSSKNMAASGRGIFSLCIYIENFKNLLSRNHWIDFNIINYFPYISINKTLKSSFQKPMDRFQYNLAEMFLWRLFMPS